MHAYDTSRRAVRAARARAMTSTSTRSPLFFFSSRGLLPLQSICGVKSPGVYKEGYFPHCTVRGHPDARNGAMDGSAVTSGPGEKARRTVRPSPQGSSLERQLTSGPGEKALRTVRPHPQGSSLKRQLTSGPGEKALRTRHSGPDVTQSGSSIVRVGRGDKHVL